MVPEVLVPELVNELAVVGLEVHSRQPVGDAEDIVVLLSRPIMLYCFSLSFTHSRDDPQV